MRHQKHGRTLGRTSDHRKAMWSNMVASLIEHEKIVTTDAKANELKRIADRTINWSAQLGDLLTRDADKLDAEDQARKLHALRMAKRVLKQPDVLRKLFDVVGPRFIGRQGGYTRVIKKGYRHGDAAPVSIVELVERGAAEEVEAPAPETKPTKAAKGAKAAAAAPAEAAAAPKKRRTKKSEAEAAE